MVSKLETEECVVCGNVIDPASLAFAQRLIDDKDFCRKCWDEIMEEVYPDETPIIPLRVAGVTINAEHR